MPFPPALILQAQPAQPQGPGGTVFFIQIAVIFAIFYFLVMRPQRKQQRLLEQSLMALAKGDEVVTAGGLIGEVVHMAATIKDGKPEPTMGDRITIRTGEAKVVVERGRIVKVAKASAG